MANLVRPVNLLPPAEERIIGFKGLNRRTTVAEGEMSDMLNLSSDDYPVLTPRKPRGQLRLPSGVVRPLRLMAKFEKIALIARTDSGVAFYYDGVKIDAVDDLSESTQMVGINTKICFFPERTYLEISPEGVPGEYGSLELSVSVPSGAAVTINAYNTLVEVPHGSGIKYDDAITIDGTLTYGSSSREISVVCIVEDIVEGDETDTLYLPANTFIEIVGEGVSSASLLGATITRGSVPRLDHVVEWNNRLWGTKSDDNTIYACKLGDPTNWQYYQGTSLDSYYAEQGTDGKWTGVATFSSHIMFFKENSICRVYGTSPSNYQISTMDAFGVESGSRQSVITINDTVYYKSRIGIMAYTGGAPVCISEGFNCEFMGVVAGTEKRKYYASCHKKGGGYELMVFDTEKGLWHKEDDTRFRSCATIGDKLYYVAYNEDDAVCSDTLACSEWLSVGSSDSFGYVGIVNPIKAEEDTATLEWMAQFGPFDEYVEEHKIYSKLALRVLAPDSSDNAIVNENYEEITNDWGEAFEVPRWMKVYISIDEGPWEQVELYEPPGTRGDFIPIVPRRCDRYSVKVEAQGNFEIKSLTRRVRRGSFGRL